MPCTTHNLPLIMTINVQKNAILIHEFSKKSPYYGGGGALPFTPSPFGRCASLLCPPPPPSEKLLLLHRCHVNDVKLPNYWIHSHITNVRFSSRDARLAPYEKNKSAITPFWLSTDEVFFSRYQNPSVEEISWGFGAYACKWVMLPLRGMKPISKAYASVELRFLRARMGIINIQSGIRIHLSTSRTPSIYSIGIKYSKRDWVLDYLCSLSED